MTRSKISEIIKWEVGGSAIIKMVGRYTETKWICKNTCCPRVLQIQKCSRLDNNTVRKHKKKENDPFTKQGHSIWFRKRILWLDVRKHRFNNMRNAAITNWIIWLYSKNRIVHNFIYSMWIYLTYHIVIFHDNCSFVEYWFSKIWRVNSSKLNDKFCIKLMN